MGTRIDKFHSQIAHLVQHTAQIPKGFLRQKTLELLAERPMSGSEISEEIQRRTAGQWKPGPGSIYPLLAWLQKNGYAAEQPVANGMKRYALTEPGRQFLAEQDKLPGELGKNERAMTFCLMDLLWFDGEDELVGELHKSMVGLVTALGEFNAAANHRRSDKAVREVKEAVDEATRKIRAVSETLGES